MLVHPLFAERPPGRMAKAALPGTLLGLPSREKDRGLRPYGLRGQNGQRGILDAMLLHPRIGTGFRNLRQELARQHVAWEALDGNSSEQERFAGLLQAMVESDRIVTDATDEGSGWRDVMSWVVDEWAYGFALANWTWGESTRGDLVLELYPVIPSTIERWVPDMERGTWVEVEQRTELLYARIPRDRLVYVRTRGAPGEWEGESILRPQLFGFESWKEASKAIIMVMAAASGVVTVEAPETGSDEQDWEAMVEQMVQFEQGIRRWFASEHGYKFDVSFPASGATGGLVEILQYWDAQIDYGLAQSMQSLGFSANGSRALGAELGEESQELRKAALEILLARLGRSIASVVAERVGYEGPLPTLHPVVERRRQIESRVRVIREAREGGLVQWTPERERDLAEELDLVGVAEPVEPVQAELPLSAAACCNHVHLAATVTVAGRDGDIFALHRELTVAEEAVAWGEIRRILLDAATDLRRDIARAASEHRAALWSVLPTESPDIPRSAIDRVQATAREAYARAVEAYAIRVATDVARESAAERHMQVQPDGARAYVMPSTDAVDDIVAGRIQALVQRAVDTIASRVWGEVEAFWAAGGTADTFETRQTELHREAEPVGAAIQAKARLIEAYDAAPREGTVPVEAVRTAILDDNLCGHCRAQDGTRYDLTDPSDIAAMMELELPDPQCEGRQRCRCGVVLRYARLEGDDLAEYLANVSPVLGGLPT